MRRWKGWDLGFENWGGEVGTARREGRSWGEREWTCPCKVVQLGSAPPFLAVFYELGGPGVCQQARTRSAPCDRPNWWATQQGIGRPGSGTERQQSDEEAENHGCDRINVGSRMEEWAFTITKAHNPRPLYNVQKNQVCRRKPLRDAVGLVACTFCVL
jgi:hypothetical protein